METSQNPKNFFQSATAKIIMVGLLTLVLLIPLQYVKNLILERSNRQKEVIIDINQKWGGSVYFYGPVLKVPYTSYTETKVTDEKTKQVTINRTANTNYAYFFPDELNAIANVTTEERNRSNYKSVLFNSKMNFKGVYTMPDFSTESIADADIQWDKASVIIETNNIKGIKGEVAMTIGSQKYIFEPAADNSSFTKGSYAALETKSINVKEVFNTKSIPFNFDISYNGSEYIKIVPIGKQTTAKMTSNWNSPGFQGDFIPENKNITDSGFTAEWKISFLNRPFVQQHFGKLPNLSEYSFDVDFVIPVNQYQQSERAAKYGFLVIGLTFLVFFLIQTISKINIHIFQYSMIGLALIMFYTLLISVTEHSSFKFAYAISGVAVIVMIGLYSLSILKNKKFPLLITTSLGALYTFIYVIIQLENYALLVGSIGLFLILGAVMYVSRKIDWSNSHA
ncbi:cell envelope integrity protein CreD [Flavobacterium arcticum]|uniref:Cell envelope integrity protein CreD n=1 Tax=Flavobacterium arcticum TaxID=1784713 RepID=A0A345HE65_9FLAO|nr:cell envelope integrity protein CreD [Flavobacterium arcticum]AXG74875.1 cell envelope integrity protein CreD [Flavobacterium arcticum]KAF2509627.1 cell envelope integrity protein CreD [Flavobacterium arcticum]